MSRLVVDPIPRIEGHLRIEVALDPDGKVSEALSSGTQARGIELILKGRDPRDAWAFAQRICGVCTLVHALASVRAVENALDITIPPNAELIRNIMAATQMLQDHVMHFYHLQALDWVNPVAALAADPAQAAALAPGETGAALAQVRTRMQGLADSGQLGLFANGWWDHPGYHLTAEQNLLLMSHYLEGLAWQREIGKINTLFGGKDPHPNLLVGGVACAISDGGEDLAGGGAGTAVNPAGLAEVRRLIGRISAFVNDRYLPDLALIAKAYPEAFESGEGTGNFLSFGDFSGPENGFGVPRGAVLNRDPGVLLPVDLSDPEQVTENVAHAWYGYEGALHPYEGKSDFAYDGPTPPFKQLDPEKGYSWVKSPRWRGKPMEVGPLARLVLLHAAKNDEATRMTADLLTGAGQSGSALYSTMGRILARGIESAMIARKMTGWLDALEARIAEGDTDTFDASKWEPRSWPAEARGVGTVEAPRGTLAHWIVIEKGKIANYQAVVPTTWNAGPKDAAEQPGPYEASLAGQHLLRPREPLEILRTIHSFDPCMACAAHVTGRNAEEIVSVRVS